MVENNNFSESASNGSLPFRINLNVATDSDVKKTEENDFSEDEESQTYVQKNTASQPSAENGTKILSQHMSQQDYSLQPMSPPAMYDYMYGVNHYVPCNFQAIMGRGITHDSAQKLNMIYAKNELDLMYKQQLKQQEELHKLRLKAIDNPNALNMMNPSADDSVAVAPNLTLKNVSDAIQDILENNMVVKEKDNYRRSYVFFWRNKEANKHEMLDEKELSDRLMDSLWELYDEQLDQLRPTYLERKLHHAIRGIPMLNDSGLKNLDRNQVVFLNGYYDLQTNAFIKTSRNHRIFNRFSCAYDFDAEATDTEVFDAMLNDIFPANLVDERIQHLVYQVIGSFMSNSIPIKKLYVFQGVSNAGKTRLQNIIYQLLGASYDDILELRELADITADSTKKNADSYRLMTIQEMPNKIISSKQESALKTYADGRDSNMKILASTNHPIKSDNDGNITKAVANRLIIVPFIKPMDEEDERISRFEDCYLDEEKSAIVHKAMRAFSEVIQTGHFVCEPTANQCVDTLVQANDNSTSDDEYFANTVVETINNNGAAISADDLLETLTSKYSFNLTRKEELGKKIKSIMGDKVISKRIKDKTYYELA